MPATALSRAAARAVESGEDGKRVDDQTWTRLQALPDPRCPRGRIYPLDCLSQMRSRSPKHTFDRAPAKLLDDLAALLVSRPAQWSVVRRCGARPRPDGRFVIRP